MTGGLEVGVGGAFGSLQVLCVCYATALHLLFWVFGLGSFGISSCVKLTGYQRVCKTFAEFFHNFISFGNAACDQKIIYL